MTKSELIERIAQAQSHLVERDAALTVNMMLDHMATCLSGGGRIEIRGFGSFSLRFRRARVGRNPRTGTPVSLPARYAPYFKPGKDLRARMNRLGTGRSVPQSTSRNVVLIGIGGQHGLSPSNSWIGCAGHGEPKPSSIDEGAADVNAEPGTCHSLASSVKFRELRTADGDRDCPGRPSGRSVVRHRASRGYSAGDADVDPARWVRPGVRCLQPVGTAGPPESSTDLRVGCDDHLAAPYQRMTP